METIYPQICNASVVYKPQTSFSVSPEQKLLHIKANFFEKLGKFCLDHLKELQKPSKFHIYNILF